MAAKTTIIIFLFFSVITKVSSQDLTLDHDKLKFEVFGNEYANLNYQYYPLGPIFELRAHHYLSTLRLNSLNRIDFRTGGNTVSDVVIDNWGYTKLGSDAPSIKMKMLYANSSGSLTGAKQLPHGLGDAERILSVQVHMNFYPGDNSTFFPPQIEFSNHNYTYFWDKFNVTVQNNGSAGSTLILNKPIRVLVIYEN